LDNGPDTEAAISKRLPLSCRSQQTFRITPRAAVAEWPRLYRARQRGSRSPERYRRGRGSGMPRQASRRWPPWCACPPSAR